MNTSGISQRATTRLNQDLQNLLAHVFKSENTTILESNEHSEESSQTIQQQSPDLNGITEQMSVSVDTIGNRPFEVKR